MRFLKELQQCRICPLIFFLFASLFYFIFLQTFEAQIGSAAGTEVEGPIWLWNIVFFVQT